MTDAVYPKDRAEWQVAIEDGIGVTGRHAHQAASFPYGKLEAWIREAFSEGFSPDFVPALLRNIRGLVAWVYEDAGEPYWPGSDGEDARPV